MAKEAMGARGTTVASLSILRMLMSDWVVTAGGRRSLVGSDIWARPAELGSEVGAGGNGEWSFVKTGCRSNSVAAGKLVK